MSQFETDQLQVNRHIRIHSGDGLVKLDVHASRDSVGCWLGSKFADVGTIGIYAGGTSLPSVMIWPDHGYFTAGESKLPFAISAAGLQVPHPDGRITLLSLSEIAALVDRIANEQK